MSKHADHKITTVQIKMEGFRVLNANPAKPWRFWTKLRLESMSEAQLDQHRQDLAHKDKQQIADELHQQYNELDESRRKAVQAVAERAMKGHLELCKISSYPHPIEVVLVQCDKPTLKNGTVITVPEDDPFGGVEVVHVPPPPSSLVARWDRWLKEPGSPALVLIILLVFCCYLVNGISK